MTASGDLLLVAHGQPSEPGPPEKWLAGLATRVARGLPGWRVRSATIAAPGALEAQVAEMPDTGLIYPMFMSDGWFVGRVLPKRLGDSPLRLLPPMGFDPALPGIAAAEVEKAMASRGWADSETTLLLAAHGSARGERAARAAHAFVEALQPLLPAMPISVGFIEQAPFLEDAARDLPARTLCLPFFALEGDHCREDIPEALLKAEFQGALLSPLGLSPAIPGLIAQAALRGFPET